MVAFAPNEDRVQELFEIWKFHRWRTQVIEEGRAVNAAEFGAEIIDSDEEGELQRSKFYSNVLPIT
jgi:hypothetical protein